MLTHLTITHLSTCHFRMHSPRIPIELCQLIVDHLDDRATLRACSLTCKALLPASRQHLFYHISLYPNIAQSFLRIICTTPSSTSPCQYIQDLSLEEGRRQKGLWINEALPLISTRLHNVTRLELDSFKWNDLNETSRTILLSGFQKVESLNTIFSKFDTPEQMSHFIPSFPSLVRLSCSQTHWLTDNIPTALTPLPHGLHSIALDSGQALLFHQLLSLEQHPSVRTINFHYMFAEYMYSVGMLLKTLGSSLENLNLDDLSSALGYQHCNAETILRNDINLAHNTRLRSISVIIFWRCGPHSLEWLFTLLSQIVSPHMVQVTLEFQLEDVSVLDTVDWGRIGHEFTQPRWDNLQKLGMIWWGPGEIRQVVKESIKTRLPALESSGVLAFDVAKLTI